MTHPLYCECTVCKKYWAQFDEPAPLNDKSTQEFDDEREYETARDLDIPRG